MTETNAAAMPPDPGHASSLDALVERLRRLKVWAGDPSYERITDRINTGWSAAGQAPEELARKNTVADCFKTGRRRINADLVVAVVQALHPEVGYVAQWRQALRVVGGQAHAASQVRAMDTLPRDLAEFTGRAFELDELRRALAASQRDGRAVVISAIEGMAGVGKTQLAIRAAHMLLADKAFDRVLFVNLRGFHPDPAQPPADPAAVLDGFLRLLGMPGHQIPYDVEARAAAYRERLGATRCLVVLDDAADAEQVGPLLPATPGCLTLITSRRHLATLPEARHLTVDVFTPAEALEFLARAVAGVPVGTDPHAAARIAEECGYLPLALSLVTGHARGRQGWTLTDHADRLAERRRHGRLDSGVALAFDLSYRDLPEDRQRLLRLASLHPGQDFDEYAAAALAGMQLRAVQHHIDHLLRDHLLQQGSPGRYGLHDLVRSYAADRAADDDRPSERRMALTRLFDYYLAATATAMDVSYPFQRRERPAALRPGTPMPEMPDHKQAELWLDTEVANLLVMAQHASTHGWPDHAWQLPATLSWHLRMRGRSRDAETLHRLALDVSRQLANRGAEVSALNNLGYVDRLLGRHEQAGEHHERAQRIAQETGDRLGELVALGGVASVHRLLGRYEQAGDHFARALRMAREVGYRVSEFETQLGLGTVRRGLGDYEQSSEHFEQAMRIAREIGDRNGEQYTLTALGAVLRMLGRYDRAGECLEQALPLARDSGNDLAVVYAANSLGDLYRMMGRHEQAAELFGQALELGRQLGSSNWQFEAHQGLGRVHQATGHPDLALDHHLEALRLATALAHPSDQARAHDGLAHTYHALNQDDQARRHWQQALALLADVGTARRALLPNHRPQP